MNAVVQVATKKSQRSEPQNSPSEVRAAYPYFHEKRTKNSAGVPFTNKKTGLPSPRYSVTLMFPKLAADAAHCANYTWLWSLAVEAAKKMWPTNVDAAGNWTWPAGAQYPVKDGDVPFVSKPKPGVIPKTPEQLAAANAWRRGYWIIESENFLDPGPRIAKMVNGVPSELPAKNVNGIQQYKSGDFGYVNIHAYAYENETFGISYGFDGFLFTREGDAIGASGPRSASQMFGNVAGTVAPPAPAAPGVTQPPVPVAAAPIAPAAPPPPVAAAPAPVVPPFAPAAPPAPGMAPLPAFPAPR